MHEPAHRRQKQKPSPAAAPPARRRPETAPGTGAGRLSAFYASGPAVPLAAPGPKKHVAVVQQKAAAVGRPGDPWEREADASADKVTHGEKAPEVSRLPSGALGAQRREEGGEEAQECAECGRRPEAQEKTDDEAAQEKGEREEAQEKGDEEETQEKADEEAQEKGDEEEAQEQEDEEAQEQGEEEAQESAAAPGRRREKGMVAARAIRERGAGEPLAPSVRSSLESGLGNDLSSVRIHSDGGAGAAAKQMRARAFTHKNHIWLAPGESQSNLKLMAHEATHVLQQDGVARRAPGGDALGRRPGEERPPAAADTTAGAPAVAPGTPAAAPGAPAAVTGAPVAIAGAPAGTAGAAAAPTGAPAGTAGAPAGAPGAPAKTPGAPAAAAGRRGAGPAAGRGAAAGPAGPAAAPAPLGAGPRAGEGPAVPHPGAEAAAAARQADDRRRMGLVKGRLGRESFRQKGPAATRPRQAKTSSGAASAASLAAPTPSNEPPSRGEAIHVDELGESATKRGKVQPPSFLALVDQKLAAMKTPKTMEQMDDFKDEGGAAELKQEVAGGVGAEVGKADGKLRGSLAKGSMPAPARVPTPLAPVPKTPPSARLGAPETAPAPRAEEEVTLEPSREKVETDLAENRLTKERLEKANDPRFTALQKGREDVHEHADRAPAQFRRAEAGALAGSRRDLQGAERASGAGMRGAHTVAQKSTRLHQKDDMRQESAERARVATEIGKRAKVVENAVRGKLEWLAGKDGEEGEVDRLFNVGEKQARDAFEGHVDREIKAWKRRRYGGRAWIPVIGGALAAGTWVYDKLKGIDRHVQKYFDAGRVKYVDGLRATIVAIAATVETALAWCHDRIAEGEKDLDDYINTKLPANLRAFGKQTAGAVFERFNELREEVDATREELADRLAERYRESEEAIDERIKEMQAENRGLVERFVEKLKEIVEALRNFRRKIGPILAEAGDVVEEIIDDPIGFLGNLLDAVGRGFSQFKERIDEHLRKGVISWLFGTLASSGIQMPKDFSLRAIGGLVLDVLGVSFDKLKARALRMLGPRAGAAAEKVAGYLGTLFREGPAGLWAELEKDVGNLKDEILEEVKSWVITRIITAAVKKLAMMFNPVGAIIQAILTIYNVIMFFLENIDRILELVRTVVRAAKDIVHGKIQAAADRIENALGMTIPLILAFLARLVGLSGVAEKVRSIIQRFRTKVKRAVDKFLRRLVAKFKRAARKAAAAGKAVAAKIFEWWKLKKRFKQGAESHTLFFTGAERAAELMIASNQRPLVEFLTERKKTATEAEKKVIRQIEVKTLAIEKLKTKTVGGKTEAADIGKERGEQIRQLFEAIAALLAQLPGATTTVRPKTLVQWKTRGDEGKSMVAKPLSVDPGELAGSAPSEESILWQAVKVRPGAYIRGHLLNHHVHGPGVKKNLVPIPAADNTRMASSFESTVKKAVLQDNEVISYSVAAVHGKQPPRTYVPEEQLIPTKLSLAAHVLNPNKKAKSDPAEAKKPGNWTKGKALIPPEKLDLTLPPDTPVGFEPKPSRINLNSPRDARFDRCGAGSSIKLVKGALADLPGIGEERASIILGNAPYRSFEQLTTLTDGAGHQFVTTEVLDRLRSDQATAGGRLFNLGGATEIQTKP